MVDVFSNIRVEDDDDLEEMESLWYNLRMFASVCLKVSDQEDMLSSAAAGSMINIPMSEKKPLPFNLNIKPRTCRRPRSKPIDAHALFPCLYKKRKIDSPINSDQDGLSQQVPKKRRLVVRFKVPSSKPEPQLPVEYKQKISELGGSDIQLVIEKTLFDGDVNSDKSRLTMPYRQCVVNISDVGTRMVKVIQPANNLRVMEMRFHKWDTVSSYVFNGAWNDLVQANGLKIGDVVQVWSFKQADQSSFALVKLST